MTPPLVSIVVPVYNTAEFLPECLDSLCRQTLQNIEIICIDDGSTDYSPEVLQKYAEKDSRIRIISKKNGGLASARNAAFSCVRGEFILFVDSDDSIAATLCEKTVEKIQASNAEAVFFYFDGYTDENGKLLWTLPFASWSPNDREKLRSKLELQRYSSAWNRLYRTRFLLDNNIRFPEGLLFEDYPFHWKVLLLSNRLSIVAEKLYHYRYRPGSLSLQRSEKLGDIIPITEIVRTFLKEHGYYEENFVRLTFIRERLNIIWQRYAQMEESLQPAMQTAIMNSLDEDDIRIINDGGGLSVRARLFYDGILAGNGGVSKLRQIYRFICGAVRGCIYRVLFFQK